MKEKNYTSRFAESYRNIGPYLGLGTQLAATIILMFFLGRWLDSKLGTEPLLLIIFSLVGGFAGIFNFIKIVLQLNKKKSDKES
jgi:F0F1-type ATP synthase assembly protein I